MAKATLNIRIADNLRERIREAAEESHQTMTAYVIGLIVGDLGQRAAMKATFSVRRTGLRDDDIRRAISDLAKGEVYDRLIDACEDMAQQCVYAPETLTPYVAALEDDEHARMVELLATAFNEETAESWSRLRVYLQHCIASHMALAKLLDERRRVDAGI